MIATTTDTFAKSRWMFATMTHAEYGEFLVGLRRGWKAAQKDGDAGQMQVYCDMAAKAKQLRAEELARTQTPLQANEIAPQTELKTGRVENYTYTIVFNGDSDNYVTIRVRDHWVADEKRRGVQVVEFLSGPQNTTDFTGIAFLNRDKLFTWKRFRDGTMANRVERAVNVLLRSGADGKREAMESYALRSNRCAHCGRPLTVAASIYRGVGPVCAENLGWS